MIALHAAVSDIRQFYTVLCFSVVPALCVQSTPPSNTLWVVAYLSASESLTEVKTLTADIITLYRCLFYAFINVTFKDLAVNLVSDDERDRCIVIIAKLCDSYELWHYSIYYYASTSIWRGHSHYERAVSLSVCLSVRLSRAST